MNIESTVGSIDHFRDAVENAHWAQSLFIERLFLREEVACRVQVEVVHLSRPDYIIERVFGWSGDCYIKEAAKYRLYEALGTPIELSCPLKQFAVHFPGIHYKGSHRRGEIQVAVASSVSSLDPYLAEVIATAVHHELGRLQTRRTHYDR